MPTPRPIIVARVGVIVPKVQKPAPRVISAMPMPTEAIARAIGRLIATALPSMTSRITTAASRPITSLRPVVGGSALATTGPPNSTCRPASSPIARVVLDQAVHRRGVHVDRLGGELDVGVGDAAVLAQPARARRQRVGHGGDAGDPLGGRHRLAHRVARLTAVEAPRPGREDHLRGVAGAGREARVEEVGGALRVGARQRELVNQGSAEALAEHDDRDDRRHPGADRSPAVGGAEMCQAGERAGAGRWFVGGVRHGLSFATVSSM